MREREGDMQGGEKEAGREGGVRGEGGRELLDSEYPSQRIQRPHVLIPHTHTHTHTHNMCVCVWRGGGLHDGEAAAAPVLCVCVCVFLCACVCV